MKVTYTRSFVKAFRDYSKAGQDVVYKTVEETLKYIETGHAAYGLRIKRLHRRIYESRVNIFLRLAYFREKDIVKFFCIGSHDDIRRCLKNLKKFLST